MDRTADAPDPLETLEAQLGYTFRDRKLAVQALTHRSHRGAEDEKQALHNERLEFLGDSIVGFLVSESLFRLLPTFSEGKLSRIKSNLVNASNLRRVAERLNLGRYLRLGPGEEKTGGREKQALLANAVEALVAALYLDGGLVVARGFVEQYLLLEMDRRGVEPLARADIKSSLQEFLQARRMPAARYELAKSYGPDHSKTFLIELWLDDRRLAQGKGASKKTAEQKAARQALEILQTEEARRSDRKTEAPAERKRRQKTDV